MFVAIAQYHISASVFQNQIRFWNSMVAVVVGDRRGSCGFEWPVVVVVVLSGLLWF